MVQILPRPHQTFGERLESGFTQGLQRGGNFAENILGKKLESQMEKKAIADKLAMLETPEFSNLFEGLDPRLARLAKGAMAGLIQPGVATSTAEMIRQSQEDINFANALGISPQSGQQNISEKQPEIDSTPVTKPSAKELPSKKTGKDFEGQISKLQNALRYASTPQKRAQVESQIKELQRQQDLDFKKEQAKQKTQFQRAQMEYKEAEPTIEYANQLALNLPNQVQDLEGLEQALKNKDFGFFSRDNLAEMTGVEGFRSSEGAQFKSSIKNYFLGDVKGVGGKGLNQWLEKQLDDAMLKIGRDNAANETVLAGFKAKHDREQLWLDEYRKLYKQQKQDNGFISGDIGLQVAENVKPYYEARQKQLEAEIKAIQASGQALSGNMVDVIGPDGIEYEIDQSQVGDLPEGWRLR